MRTWSPARPGRLAISRHVRARHGPVLRADEGDLGGEHPQLRRGNGHPARATCSTPQAGRRVGCPGPLGRCPDLERARRHGHATARVRRGRRRDGRVPLEGARAPVGSLVVGDATPSPRRESGASGWAAACVRPASSRRPACMPWTTTSSASPTTTPTRGCWPGRAACTGRRGHQHRGLRARGRRRVRPAPESRSAVATVGPTTVRLVTHLDVDRADAETAAASLATL